MKLLMFVALAAAAAWFTPQMSEGTETACAAFEKRMLAVMPGDPRVVREAAAQTTRALSNLPHGGACVVGWWKMFIDPTLGGTVG